MVSGPLCWTLLHHTLAHLVAFSHTLRRRRSVTFDPFYFLSLPVPREQGKPITVIFSPWQSATSTVEGSRIQYDTVLPSDATVLDLKEALGAEFGVESSLLITREVYQQR